MTNLLLIPTEPELRFLRPRLHGFAHDGDRCGDWTIGLCGFGLIASAARSAMLIAQQRPRRVLLVGIAGALGESLPIGSAWAFDRVVSQGIGVGSDADYLSVVQMGWSHWPGSPSTPAIGDVIELTNGGPAMQDSRQLPTASATTLLSVCAASAHRRQAQQRQQSYPEAIAEDMEGFAVALACALAGVPLQIIRGISNRAGDRDLRCWQIESALEAAAELANQRLRPVVEGAG